MHLARLYCRSNQEEAHGTQTCPKTPRDNKAIWMYHLVSCWTSMPHDPNELILCESNKKFASQDIAKRHQDTQIKAFLCSFWWVERNNCRWQAETSLQATKGLQEKTTVICISRRCMAHSFKSLASICGGSSWKLYLVRFTCCVRAWGLVLTYKLWTPVLPQDFWVTELLQYITLAKITQENFQSWGVTSTHWREKIFITYLPITKNWWRSWIFRIGTKMQNLQDIFDPWESFENFTSSQTLQAPQYMTSLITLIASS